MDNNQNNNHNNNKNKRNGLLILVAWAIVLTVVFNYLSAASRQANTAASTHEIHYSEFQDLVEEGVVEEVLFADGQIRLTTKEGYVYTDEEGNTIPVWIIGTDAWPWRFSVDGYTGALTTSE